MAETCYRTIDHAGVRLPKGRVIEAEAGQPTDLKVFDYNVSLCRECLNVFKVFRVSEVCSYAELAAITAVEICSRSVALSFYEWWPPLSGVVAFRTFDFDHRRAKIGQNLTDPRAR